MKDSLDRKGLIQRRSKVMVIDDVEDVAAAHASMLATLGYEVDTSTDPVAGLNQVVSDRGIGVVLLDIRMPEMSGLEILRSIKTRRPDCGVIMATVVNDIDQAVEAIKSGAYNYLLKPLQAERLDAVLESYYVNRPGHSVDSPVFSPFITQDKKFEEIFRRVASFAKADVPVLIHGETGTGKELIAQMIHAASDRSDKAYHAVNMGALSQNIFESELFGHAKGAFTGAHREHSGHFGEIGEGTIFLDEIGELSLDQQKRLLRVLQNGEYSRVGETSVRNFTGRIVFASNRDLKQEVDEGAFREDLYYRIANYEIRLPPLRERKGDIELLAGYFFEKYRSQFGRDVHAIGEDAMSCLREFKFPGNVRELEGLISAAILIEESHELTEESFPDHVRFAEHEEHGEEGEKAKALIKALELSQGNRTRAAEQLKVSRQYLYVLIERYRKLGFDIPG